MVRQPAVAGRFYPRDARDLSRMVDRLVEPVAEKVRAVGCVVPHAGYVYSGAVAGAVFSRLELPARILILGPRHYPQGADLAINSQGTWRTPLGDVTIDSELAQELKNATPLLQEDSIAHRDEHSLEVQLPLLQRLVREFRFVPIAVGPLRFEPLEELGRSAARVLAKQKEPALIVASSDFNHYESDAVTRVKDRKAIDRILALDPRGLYDTVRREDISMCGYGPAVAMLTAARELGATHAELVRYATSGDVSGDRDAVVGYAGIVLS